MCVIGSVAGAFGSISNSVSWCLRQILSSRKIASDRLIASVLASRLDKQCESSCADSPGSRRPFAPRRRHHISQRLTLTISRTTAVVLDPVP
jgi:hypothetical protein